MPRPELHRTLVEAVRAVSPQPGSGIEVTEVALDLPLEIVAGTRDGRPVIGGTAPHSRWVAGFLPAVHLARMHIVRVDPPAPARRGGD
jgi:hypothetical protein